jgi:hypothetical protein
MNRLSPTLKLHLKKWKVQKKFVLTPRIHMPQNLVVPSLNRLAITKTKSTALAIEFQLNNAQLFLSSNNKSTWVHFLYLLLPDEFQIRIIPISHGVSGWHYTSFASFHLLTRN